METRFKFVELYASMLSKEELFSLFMYLFRVIFIERMILLCDLRDESRSMPKEELFSLFSRLFSSRDRSYCVVFKADPPRKLISML